MKRKYFSVVFLLLIVLARILSSDKSVKVMRNLFYEYDLSKKYTGVTIVVDPGHGGRDPGKVGINGALEKDINLAIALLLRDFLEDKGINVIMTRTEDVGLYSESDTNKKRADLNKRIEIINSSNALFAVSIHQNSFSQENIRGAQVFYYANSEQGRILAETLQEHIKETLKDGNHRKAKSNTIYYMLKHTKCPFVIVECGYLTNRAEASLLINPEYQEKMAKAIGEGILKYLNLIDISNT